jgi:hypothetical protein
MEGDDNDSLSIRSETRNGHGHGYGHQHGNTRGGSIGGVSLGGLSGPRPLPSKSGSAEKMSESWQYHPLGRESPNVCGLYN